jgi:hypothetical protein
MALYVAGIESQAFATHSVRDLPYRNTPCITDTASGRLWFKKAHPLSASGRAAMLRWLRWRPLLCGYAHDYPLFPKHKLISQGCPA